PRGLVGWTASPVLLSLHTRGAKRATATRRRGVQSNRREASTFRLCQQGGPKDEEVTSGRQWTAVSIDIELSGNALVLSMMHFAHEIRSPKDLDLPKAGEGWTKKEMDLAHRLIDTLADKWKAAEFRDTYTEVLRKRR